FGLASVIGILSDIALRVLWFGGDNRPNNPVFFVIGIAVVILAPVMAALIQSAVSRQREYLADATGAMTTRDPEALASALEKLGSYSKPLRRQSTATAHLFFTNPLSPGSIMKLFSTHPPLEKRVERLRSKLTSI